VIPEDRAARVVWQIFGKGLSWTEFRAVLDRHRNPEWNRAVRLIADAIREAETPGLQARQELNAVVGKVLEYAPQAPFPTAGSVADLVAWMAEWYTGQLDADNVRGK